MSLFRLFSGALGWVALDDLLNYRLETQSNVAQIPFERRFMHNSLGAIIGFYNPASAVVLYISCVGVFPLQEDIIKTAK